jgi:hypothetical protein
LSLALLSSTHPLPPSANSRSFVELVHFIDQSSELTRFGGQFIGFGSRALRS